MSASTHLLDFMMMEGSRDLGREEVDTLTAHRSSPFRTLSSALCNSSFDCLACQWVACSVRDGTVSPG